MIRPGFHPELDELLSLSQDSKTWIANYQAKEAQRTGIQNLKVGFNKVFGYYIEITAANFHVELPKEYVRKQTTKNSERYITDELKVFETKVLDADEGFDTLDLTQTGQQMLTPRYASPEQVRQLMATQP